MGKLILTARGLNSGTGRKIIRKCLPEEEERETQTILLISIKEYRIDEILKQASIGLGFTDEHIFLASGQIDLKKLHPDYIYVTEGNVYQQTAPTSEAVPGQCLQEQISVWQKILMKILWT